MTDATPEPTRVAVIGTGVIGRSWLRVFTRAGCAVRAWDPDAATLAASVCWHERELALERSEDRAGAEPPVCDLLACASLSEALEDVQYVQESGPESLPVKRVIYAELDRLAPPGAILASSTSALDMTAIADGLRGASRCVIAHPVNPPHVVPVVEVLGGRETDRAAVDRTIAVLRAAGQRPVELNRYVPGFLVNRMQAALVREAIALLEDGVADAHAIDAVIHEGLGLRWALLGPFGVADTNADGGAREYFARYGASFERLMRDLSDTPTIDAALVERIGGQTDAMANRAERAAVREWRDRLVRGIVRLKRENPCP